MYIYQQGDLFQSGAQALVNTVNTVGVMGKGIALQFKKRYPEMFKEYAKICKDDAVQIGKMWIYKTNSLTSPEYIINFPTKRHWRDKSRIEDIFLGLVDLSRVLVEKKIRSVAIPPLGCGNGGLPWTKVSRIMEEVLTTLPTEKIFVYEPSDQHFSLPKGQKPILTSARAAILDLMFQFLELGYENTWLSVQKLAYFLQEAGLPLKLSYQKYKYGPYSDKLRHLMLNLEGHYLQGMYDGNNLDRFTILEPLPEIRREVTEFVKLNTENTHEIDRVKNLIYGFESPYGLELLATVHWSVIHDGKQADDLPGIIENVKAWTPRKAALMTDEHITVAYNKLMAEAWLEARN